MRKGGKEGGICGAHVRPSERASGGPFHLRHLLRRRESKEEREGTRCGVVQCAVRERERGRGGKPPPPPCRTPTHREFSSGGNSSGEKENDSSDAVPCRRLPADAAALLDCSAGATASPGTEAVAADDERRPRLRHTTWPRAVSRKISPGRQHGQVLAGVLTGQYLVDLHSLPRSEFH